MGLTPLEGLVMGTRSGDIDAGVIGYLCRAAKMNVDEVDSMLNHHSGLFGLAGELDFRRLQQMIETGDAAAQLAYDVFVHRLRKYVGAYLAVLGRTDVVSFTAGVGENVATVRRDALSGLGVLGIEIDQRAKRSVRQGCPADFGRHLADRRTGDPHQRGTRDRPRLPTSDLGLSSEESQALPAIPDRRCRVGPKRLGQ